MLALLALALGVLVYRGSGRGAPAEPGPSPSVGAEARVLPGPSPEAQAEVPPQGESLERAGTASLDQVPQDLPQRQGLAELGLRGRVVDSEGEGIENVELLWIAPTAQDLDWEAGWQADDWGPLARSEVRTQSVEAGHYQFSQAPAFDPLIGSALWAIAPGYVSQCQVVEFGLSSLPQLTLQRAASLSVRVEDALGVPVAGARVEHYGLTPASAPLEVGGALQPLRLRRLLHQEGVSGSDGRLVLGAFPGEQVLRASAGKRISQAWRGPAPGSLVLRLLDSFEVSGTVGLPDWSHLNYEGERRLQIGVQEGELWNGLVTLRGVGAGTWGPVSLPWWPDKTYCAKLEGSPIIPLTHYFQAGALGESVVLDFQAQLGSSVWICGLDEAGEPVRDVTASVWWFENGIKQTLRRRAAPGTEYANPWSMPPGELHFSVSAPGWAPGTGLPFSLPESEARAHAAQLFRAGKLRGRVLQAGQPVENFDLWLWKKYSGTSNQRISFRGRLDGRFEVDSAPVGALALSATSGFLPPARAQVVEVPSQGSVEVLIELEAPVTASGRVVDLETGEPVGEASLQVNVRHDGLASAAVGLPQRARSNGEFQLRGLVAGTNFIQVRAPGYATLLLTPEGKPGEELDLGTLSLARPRSVELRLVSSDPGVDFREYSAAISFPSLLPRTPFGADGVLRCNAGTPGNYLVNIWKGDVERARIRTSFFPGRPWQLEHRVGGKRQVQVQCSGSEEIGVDLVQDLYLLYGEGLHVRTTLLAQADREGRGRFAEVGGDPVGLYAVGTDGQTLGRASGSFGDQDLLALNAVLGSTPVQLRVLDSSGAGIPMAQVNLRERGGAPFVHFGRTDQQGLLNCFGLESRALDAFVSHPDHGRGLLRLEGGQESPSLTLSNDSSLRVRLFDGAFPLSDAHVGVADAQGKRIFGYQPAGADGEAHMQGYRAGDYDWIATHPHAWPVYFRAQASTEDPVFEVQMRRLGNLRLRVIDASGSPRRGVRVDLRGDGEDGDVQAWVAAGRVQAPSMQTDDRGELLLQGLPRGEYRWSIGAESGGLEVKPLVTQEQTLVLGG